MSRHRSLVLAVRLLTCAVLPGCGGASATPAATASPSQPASAGSERPAPAPLAGPSSQPEGALRLGHYSIVSGREGFVLDLTGRTALIAMDGSNRVVELSESAGPSDSIELRNDSADLWLRITEYHEVLFDGPNQHEGVYAVRDANATPLR